MIFKGLLLDLGDTLAFIDKVEFKEYEEELAVALKKSGYGRCLKDIARAMNEAYLKSSTGELKTAREFWNLMLLSLKIPKEPSLPAIMQKIREHRETTMWKLYNGTLETLSALQSKYKMALVSNCARGTDKVIHSLGLTSFFDCLILSYQVGSRKPDCHNYLEALKCLGIRPQKCIFVADEISDLEGARDVGLRTMLVKQGHSTFQEARDLNFKPDFQIAQISEITKIL